MNSLRYTYHYESIPVQRIRRSLQLYVCIWCERVVRVCALLICFTHNHPLTHSSTHLLTHPLTHPLTLHSLTHSLIQSIITYHRILLEELHLIMKKKLRSRSLIDVHNIINNHSTTYTHTHTHTHTYTYRHLRCMHAQCHT